ncbi:MAG TPA: hypothetical protein DDZ51_27285 [Planctomycetaceae bacterium]|nr:hypothetical protein [Planctomycetaceae bacterium]
MTKVPITPFRSFRKSCSFTKTRQREEAKRFAGDFNALRELWNSSVKLLETYEFDGPFHLNRRKQLPPSPSKISAIGRTTDAAAYFEKLFQTPVDFLGQKFMYLDREIATLRTPKAKFSDGKSASTSGRGGMDLLLGCGRRVCAGEVKIRGDSELFGALLQVMWYGSEIATRNQITRIKQQYPLNEVETDKVDLAVFSIEQSGETKDKTRRITLEIVAKINDRNSGFSQLGQIHLFENIGDGWSRISS